MEGIGSGALLAALTLYTSFTAGGYFADSTGIVAAVLLLGLALHVAIAQRPFAGIGRRWALAGGALALLAVWSLVSAAWSHAPGRAILEFDRTLLYLLTLVSFGAAAGSALRLRRAADGLAVAVIAVAVAALATRLAPDVFHTSANIMPERLSFPLTYWNALALLAGFGSTLCLAAACGADRAPAVRAGAAAALPPLAVTLLLTYSRGGVAVAVVMAALYVVLARPRGFVATILAAGPPAAVALVAAYGADLLASADPTTAAAAAQGHRVLGVLVVCSVAAGVLRFLLARRGDIRVPSLPPRVRRSVLVTSGVAAAIVVAVGVVHAVQGFKAQPSQASLADTRSRLTDPSSNGRVQYWRTALDAFDQAPVHGTGAGTYQLEWWRHRRAPQTVSQAHSLYLQALGELGLVGLVLVLVALGAVVWPLVRGARADGTTAALAACAVGWIVHAAFDWDWEVPAVTLWLFAVGGIALARPAVAGLRSPGLATRAVAGVLLITAASFPALVAASQRELDSALAAYGRGDCDTVADAAASARAAMPPRDEPRQLLGYCAARAGRSVAAIADLRAAVSRDPGDWEDAYGLAVVLAAAGRDPGAEAARAGGLNPIESSVQELVAPPAGPSTWKRRARGARLFIDGLDYPPLGG